MEGFDAIYDDRQDDLVALLENKQITVNYIDFHGQSYLTFAVMRNKYQCVRILVENKANINGANEHYETPLYMAASYNCPEIVQYLIKNGASIITERRTFLNRSPLHVAALGGFLSCVKLLTKADANLDTKDTIGDTPLMASVRTNREFVFRFLVDSGANIEGITKFTVNWPLTFLAKRRQTKHTIIIVMACFRRRLGLGHDMANMVKKFIWDQRDVY